MLLLLLLLLATSGCFMARRGRPNASIWDEYSVVEGTEMHKYKDVTCNHCRATLKRVQPSRGMLNHAARCPEMPSFLRNQYKDALVNRKQRARRVLGEGSEIDRVQGVFATTDRPESNAIAAPEQPGSDTTRKFRFQMAIAMFFYTTSVAFRVVELPGFRQMFACICPAVNMPNRQDLAGRLLNFACNEERKTVIAVLRDIPFVALVSDGWSNPRRESLINFIIVAPGIRPLLWTCRVTGEATKTGAYMAQMIGEVVDEIETEIGVGKVVSITTDNAPSMKSAWAILEGTRPGFLATGCAAHTLSLLMKDVLSFETLKNILDECKDIALFIRSHTATNARFRIIQESDRDGSQRGLKLPVATRWYSAYECIKMVMENERTIRDLFDDQELLSKYDSAIVFPLSRLVASEVFWAKGGVALQLLSPIHKCLAHFEKDNLCLSVIYQQFVELSRHPVYNTTVPGIENPLQRFFKDRIKYRWEFIHKSAMSMSFLLDHTKPTSIFIGTDKLDSISEILKLAALLGYNEEKRRKLQLEVTQFLSEKLNWSDETRALYYVSHPAQWWTWEGRDKYPLLAPIAERIFAIPTSSAASERSWSIFKFIHSARRNCLKNETVVKLAFVYSNHGPKEATSPVEVDAVIDLVQTSGENSSEYTNPPGSVSEEMLASIREMERLVGLTDDMAALTDTPVLDATDFLHDERAFDGAHWADESDFPNPSTQSFTEIAL